jgi:hypothetical protein
VSTDDDGPLGPLRRSFWAPIAPPGATREMSQANVSLPPSPTPAGVAADARPKVGIPQTIENAAPRGLGRLARWAFSFPAMLATFIIGRVFYEGRGFAVDPDLWWHIKVGQEILATHKWPTTDPFSFTVPGVPWLAYEWLGDVAIGAAAKFGFLGLDVFLIVVASIVMLAIYALASVRARNSKAGFVAAALLCSLAFASFNLRPQMFGYLFLVLVLIALERFRQGKTRALWFLPLLFLVWINAHGSWVIGLGVLFVYFASGLWEFQLGSISTRRWTFAERIRLELAFLLCLAAIPITPYGTQLAAYPFTVASTLPLNVGNVLEWQPMPFNLPGGKLFLAVLLVFFLAQMLFRTSWHLAEVLLCFGGIVMACLHMRFVLLFVPFFTPLFATLLATWIAPYNFKKDYPFVNAALMAGALIAMIHYFPTEASIAKIAARNFPIGAVRYLKAHPTPGPMYNTYGYGGYLIWAYPEQKVFIDGRGDLYEHGGAFGEYLQVAGLKPAANMVLRAHHIQSMLLDAQEPLVVALDSNPEWEKRYSDGVSTLFVRRDGSTRSASAAR